MDTAYPGVITVWILGLLVQVYYVPADIMYHVIATVLMHTVIHWLIAMAFSSCPQMIASGYTTTTDAALE